VFSSSVPLPELPEIAPPVAAPTIEFTSFPLPDQPRWSTVWRLADGRAWAQTARDGAAFYVRVTGFADFRITAEGIAVRVNPTARESTIRHLLLDQVLPIAMAAEGRLVLHASAVCRADLGIIALAGPAGAGKSTMAAALVREGWSMASDDGLLIEAVEDRPIAVPAYPGLRMWPDAADAAGLTGSAISEVAEYSAKVRVTAPNVCLPAPLRAVYVMENAERCRVEALGDRDATMALVEHAYRAEPYDAAALIGQLEACAAVVTRVAVMRLLVPRDLEQLARAARIVSAHATVAHR
jgi:hypothetical protein